MKRFVAIIILSLLCVFVAVGFTVCGGDNTNNIQDNGQEEQTVPQEQSEDKENVNTVSAAALLSETVNNYDYDFTAEYNGAINRIVNAKYSADKVVSIDGVAIEDNLLTVFITVNDGEETQTEIYYRGNASEMVGAEQYTKSELINQITTEFNVNDSTEITENGTEYNNFINVINGYLDNIKAKITAVKEIPLESITELEYITVREIVDEIWGDVDVDKDIKEIAEHFWSLPSKIYYSYFVDVLAIDVGDEELNLFFCLHRDNSVKLAFYNFSVDIKYLYNLHNEFYQNCYDSFVAEGYSEIETQNLINYGEEYINIFGEGSIPAVKIPIIREINKILPDLQSEKAVIFAEIVNDKQTVINNIVQQQLLTCDDTVAKFSLKESELRENLDSLKSNYNEIKSIYIGIENKEIIDMDGFFSTDILSEETMESLGMESMGEFAYALLTNTRGTRYGELDFTMNDVIDVYVGQVSSMSIHGYSAFHIYLLTKTGIRDYFMQVDGSSGLDDYKKLLRDSDDITYYFEGRNLVLVDYSENAIVYDTDGKRI